MAYQLEQFIGLQQMDKYFKAKKIIDGEWLEFDFTDIAGTYASGRVEILTKDCTETIAVALDTVSMFTGLNDSEGNKIFEDDEIKTPEESAFVEFESGVFFATFSDNFEPNIYELTNIKLTGRNIHDKDLG